MRKITMRRRVERKWVDVTLPDGEKELWEAIRAVAGREFVVEIITDRIAEESKTRYQVFEYYCGTEEIFNIMVQAKKSKPNSCVMTTEDAVKLYDFDPAYHNAVVHTFFGEDDVKRVFPEPLSIPVKAKGWDHLKERK